MFCKHLSNYLRSESCTTCKGSVQKKVYTCNLFGECTLSGSPLYDRPVCETCPHKSEKINLQNIQPLPEILNVRELPEWSYITSQMLSVHSLNLLQYVPDNCKGIVGVARSGLVSATLIATTLNLPLWELSGQNGLRPIGSGSRTSGLTKQTGPFFVVDDSAYSGRASINARKAMSQHPAIISVVYCRPEAINAVDCYSVLLPSPHLFEWNLFNNGIVHGNASDPRLRGGIGFDFDGVLCEDCPVNDKDHEAYKTWLETAKPRSLPRLTDIPLIATARIRRYENETRQWLNRYNLRVRKLQLYPADTNNRSGEQVVYHKSRAAKNAGISIFVESNQWQAENIAKVVGIPVICTDSSKVYV